MTTAGPLVSIAAACRLAETEADLEAATARPLAALNDDPGPDGADLEIARALIDAATARLRAEVRLTDLGQRVDQAQQLAEAARLHESQVRRRQALELNDIVVQRLAAALLAQGQERHEEAATYIDQTLTAARRLINEWIGPASGTELTPGDLLRSTSSGQPDEQSALLADADMGAEVAAVSAPRVLIVDDNDDVRRLIQIQLEVGGNYDVVGVAANGLEAVEQATELRPDVVLLDLAMPVMDGLEALPLIKAAVPDVQVIVLSGFDEGPMRDVAMKAGAAKYIEKGVRMGLPGHIDEVMSR